MKRLLNAQLVNTFLSHPETPELVARVAREAVTTLARELEHRAVVRALEREHATIVRDDQP